MEQNNINQENKQGKLQRQLGFWALVFFGVIFMSPTSGLVYYPTTQPWSGGFSYLGYIVALILVILTVLSYQIMVKEFPETGSAYAYSSRGINGKVGFMVGWILLIDYALIPMFALKLASIYLNNIFTVIPGWVFVLVLGVFITVCCCLGVKVGVTMEIIMGIYMILLVVFFSAECIIHISNTGSSVFNPAAIYDPQKIIWSGVLNTAALGILAFVGFDGITTLSEESKITEKKLALTLMVAVLIQGSMLIVSTYLAQAAMDWTTIPESEFPTAYRYMLTIFINPVVSGVLVVLQKMCLIALCIAAITSASRILYGMGRDGVISNSFFGYLSPKLNTPTKNSILLGTITIAGGLTLDWTIIAEVVSFGACIGFIFVNLSVISYFWFRKNDKKIFRNLIFPIIAAIGILWVMTTLSSICLTLGCAWTVIGLIYLVVKYKTSQKFRDNINKGNLEL